MSNDKSLREARTGAGGVPIFESATFAHSSAEGMAEVFEGRAPGHVYTRNGNPTTVALESRLTVLEGGTGCIATSSGMAALATVMLGLLRPGDEILSATGIFGGSISLFRDVLGPFGVRTTLLDAADTDAVQSAVSQATRVIFLETIGNPRMDVPDLAALSQIAHKNGAILVVDSTLTTPVLVRPGDFGADIVIHSTTKFINGHGTSLGGAIIDTGRKDWAAGPFADVVACASKEGPHALLSHLRHYAYRDLGGCPAPWSSHQMLQGLETLSVRMPIHCDNALRLAEVLAQRPDVAWVNYPGLPDSKFHTRVSAQFRGLGGGVLTLGLGNRHRAFRFLNSLNRATLAANLGETRTLVIHPASTIFHDYAPSERILTGVTDDLVRISVGLEPTTEILDDVAHALDASLE